jgi:hypothetical protein
MRFDIGLIGVFVLGELSSQGSVRTGGNWTRLASAGQSVASLARELRVDLACCQRKSRLSGSYRLRFVLLGYFVSFRPPGERRRLENRFK